MLWQVPKTGLQVSGGVRPMFKVFRCPNLTKKVKILNMKSEKWAKTGRFTGLLRHNLDKIDLKMVEKGLEKVYLSD